MIYWISTYQHLIIDKNKAKINNKLPITTMLPINNKDEIRISNNALNPSHIFIVFIYSTIISYLLLSSLL